MSMIYYFYLLQNNFYLADKYLKILHIPFYSISNTYAKKHSVTISIDQNALQTKTGRMLITQCSVDGNTTLESEPTQPQFNFSLI